MHHKNVKNVKSGKVRIIAGQWRGRKLTVLNKPGLRPTPDRVRETLFNWLAMQVPGSCCLDLFAGSGALGIEAVSRGADAVTLVEQNPDVVRHLTEQIVQFSTNKVTVVQSDVLQFLQKPATAFDIVFLDPPFTENVLNLCCELLEHRGWLLPNARIYLERARNFNTLQLPANWQIIRQQTAGQVAYCLAVRQP